MADNKNNVSQQPQLCKQGCGFYGNPNFDGMCSKCYKDYVQRKANASGVMGRASPSMNTSSERASSLSAAFANAVSSSAPSGLTVDEMRALINPETTSNESRVHSASVSVDTDAARSNATLADVASGAASTGDIDKATGAAGGEKAQNASETGAQASGVKPLNRCAQCQKKVGLTGFTCRCGGTYCADHRYSDRHACQFDYKQRGAEELRKLNPVVVAEKLHKI